MTDISILVSGKEHSGKGHMVALISKLLRDHGIAVVTQGEETHNAPKFEASLNDHLTKLGDAKVVITEMQVG